MPTALIAARMLLGGGEVKTAPATAPLNMPGPMKPKNEMSTVYKPNARRLPFINGFDLSTQIR